MQGLTAHLVLGRTVRADTGLMDDIWSHRLTPMREERLRGILANPDG